MAPTQTPRYTGLLTLHRYLAALSAAGLLYHMDDDPRDCPFACDIADVLNADRLQLHADCDAAGVDPFMYYPAGSYLSDASHPDHDAHYDGDATDAQTLRRDAATALRAHMRALGATEYGTGGGCMTLGFTGAGGRYVFVTDGNACTEFDEEGARFVVSCDRPGAALAAHCDAPNTREGFLMAAEAVYLFSSMSADALENAAAF